MCRWIRVLLDPAGNPLGEGQAGEIVVCGDHISPGYWKHPERSAERFVQIGGRRAYRTGDLGEWLADGSLLHLGRVDSQVKIRGHRVEVGEVELALLQHPAVREAAVAGEKDGEGRTLRLLGYVVLHPSAKVAGSELQAFLRTRLPDFMLPAVILILPRLPQTPNGKVDRLALPKPDRNAAAAVDQAAASTPVDHVEAQLLEIWQSVFGNKQITRNANFFELGGDSLSAVRILARMHAVFGLEKSIRVVLENPMLAALASVVRRDVEYSDL